ncbi:MAG: universal stress protein [Dehalococcoidia bacterium]
MTSDAPAGLRVLFATDGSGPARDASSVLRQLILPVTSKLTVLSVAPQSFLSGARPDPAFLLKATPAARRTALAESEEEAQAAATELDPDPEIDVDVIARWGNPIEEILRAARRAPADLVVLGAKGHSGLGIMLLGSVSQGVVQNSTLPVLIVRPDIDHVSKVLIGYDDSPEARKAINFLDRLQLPLDVEIILSYVDTPFPKAQRGSKRNSMAAAQAAAERNHDIEEAALGGVAAHFATQGYRVSTEVLNGTASSELDESARKHRAGIIIVGSRKPAPARHYLIGSTAEKLVRHAEASVLVVR